MKLFEKTKALLQLSPFMISLRIWKTPDTLKLLLLKGILMMILYEEVEGRNWSVHNHTKAGVCRNSRGPSPWGFWGAPGGLHPKAAACFHIGRQGMGTHGSFSCSSQHNSIVEEHQLELPCGLGAVLSHQDSLDFKNRRTANKGNFSTVAEASSPHCFSLFLLYILLLLCTGNTCSLYCSKSVC